MMIINKRAKYDYEILETFEAGIALKGFEVKAIRQGKLSLNGSYVVVKAEGRKFKTYLLNAYISPYQQDNTDKSYEPTRSRQLLLHSNELRSILGKIKQKGLTLVPLCVYNKRTKIKLEFALAKGKRKIDKREAIKKREVEREMRRKILNFKF